jgi:hypothetical protein
MYETLSTTRDQEDFAKAHAENVLLIYKRLSEENRNKKDKITNGGFTSKELIELTKAAATFALANSIDQLTSVVAIHSNELIEELERMRIWKDS